MNEACFSVFPSTPLSKQRAVLEEANRIRLGLIDGLVRRKLKENLH